MEQLMGAVFTTRGVRQNKAKFVKKGRKKTTPSSRIGVGTEVLLSGYKEETRERGSEAHTVNS